MALHRRPNGSRDWLNMTRAAITELPPTYREVFYFTANDPQTLLRLNLWALVPMLIALVGINNWLAGVRGLRGVLIWDTAWLDILPIAFALVGVLLLHEWLHGLAIQWYGHKSRYGAKYAALGKLQIPIMLYATTDNGLFRRHEFIVIALTPLLVITLLGMAAGFILPDNWHFYLTLAVILNAGGAIGDIWMTWLVLRYPASSLVRDEADSIRIYVQGN
jgi:Putative zincin peptidase